MTRIADYRPTHPRPVGPGAPMRPAPATPVVETPSVRRPSLSPREVEVLLAWLRAESKEEAAEHLFIAASTVSTHLARIRAKYSGVGRPAPTKTHLLARALQDGITQLEDW
ncbi:helix-turn-helix transcriptional regulator [Gordonia sp. VNQ95]|uniref:response regulator transcription factor n=1 Tax=Gordonia sp. VNQ95 TaxID=3156619 RepID=UPI0032B330ED